MLERTLDYRISTWRNAMFLAWRETETVTGIVRSRSLMEPWSAERPGSVVLVVLMPPKAILSTPPSQDARVAMASAARDAPASFKGIAIIGHENGLVGSVVRSVMTSQQSMVKSTVPFRMFPSGAAAAPWLSRCLDLPEDLGSDFVSMVGRARWK